jgi:ribosome-binding protein aMBF1 (putative translation factor)
MPVTRKDAGSKETFMSLLRRHRKARGLSQTALAHKMKVKPSAVHYWESGASCPSAKRIPKLARILEIDRDYLVDILEAEAPGVGAR